MNSLTKFGLRIKISRVYQMGHINGGEKKINYRKKKKSFLFWGHKKDLQLKHKKSGKGYDSVRCCSCY